MGAIVRPDTPIVVGISLGVLAVLVVQEGDHLVQHSLRHRKARATKRPRELEREVGAKALFHNEILKARAGAPSRVVVKLDALVNCTTYCGFEMGLSQAFAHLEVALIEKLEDKVAQGAVTMVLEAVYEQDFLPCSYGFRPGRSAHQALHALRSNLWAKRLHWVVDVDIRKCFDSISHFHLRTFLDQRVTDGVIRWMISKWLKAGAVEDGLLRRTTEGSPQGGVISPCLSNVFLHHVLDECFETKVKPRLQGESILVRFADDAVMAFDNIVAKRVNAVLGKRLARFGLTLHPDKTRLIDFRPQTTEGVRHPETDGISFDFLGLTHVWGRSRNGRNMVRQVTAQSRFARALAAASNWCRKNRHRSIRDQHRHLSSMMRGHFAYYGVGGNGRRLRWFAYQVVRIWQKWLSRRDRQSMVRWTRLNELLKRHPLPPAKVFHPYLPASESLS